MLFLFQGALYICVCMDGGLVCWFYISKFIIFLRKLKCCWWKSHIHFQIICSTVLYFLLNQTTNLPPKNCHYSATQIEGLKKNADFHIQELVLKQPRASDIRTFGLSFVRFKYLALPQQLLHSDERIQIQRKIQALTQKIHKDNILQERPCSYLHCWQGVVFLVCCRYAVCCIRKEGWKNTRSLRCGLLERTKENRRACQTSMRLSRYPSILFFTHFLSLSLSLSLSLRIGRERRQTEAELPSLEGRGRLCGEQESGPALYWALLNPLVNDYSA